MKIIADINKVVLQDFEPLISGAYRDKTIDVELSADYDGLSVWAIFDRQTVKVEGGKCYTPTLERGTCSVGIYAVRLNDDKEIDLRYSPAPALINIEQGSYNSSLNSATAPTESEVERIYALIDEAIKAGMLKGEKGDPGTPGKDGAPGKDGTPGKDGYTPIKGVDYFDGVKGDKGEKGDPSVIAIDDSTFNMWNMGDAIYCTKEEVTIKSDSDNESTIVVPQGTLIASYKPKPYFGNAYHYLIIIGECTFKDKKYKYGIHRYYNITDEIVSSTSFDDFALKTEIPTKTSQLTNDNDFVSDADYTHTDNNFTDAEKLKLGSLVNYDDTEIKKQIAIKQDALTAEQLKNISNVPNKIDKTAVGNGLKFADGKLQLDIPVATSDTGYGG
uniref:Nucleoid-associated protein n=1 Tax=Siphoviridae sp. ctbxa26 TaxID=2825568 RepID=A0A8S5VEU1_9CAUD|nr:MAG TPA: nucleoid-associated protein [Siphoviridae sp. ctbxa26]